MDDIQFFLKYGWKSIWKQKTIWFFSSLLLLNQILQFFQIKAQNNPTPSLLASGISFLSIFTNWFAYVGIPYSAYSFFISEPTTVREVVQAVKKFTGRLIGCSCLSLVFFFPVMALAMQGVSQGDKTADKILLVFLPFSIFSALWYFVANSFFSHDWGISKALKEVWSMYWSHFLPLAILGSALVIVMRLAYIIAAGAVVLLQGALDLSVFYNISFWNPHAALVDVFSYQLVSGLLSAFSTTLIASIFTLAYLKYSGVKISKSLLDA